MRLQEEQIKKEKEALERKLIEDDIRRKTEYADAQMAARREHQLREKQKKLELLR